MAHPAIKQTFVSPELFDEAAARVNLHERIRATRPNQLVRGVFFSMVRDVVARHDPTLLEAYDARCLPDPMVYRLYSVADYLRSLVFAAALCSGVDDLHEGMRAIHRASTPYFAQSLIGRLIVSVVRPQPIGLLRQIERSRSLVSSYGTLRVEVLGERAVRVEHRDEPVFVESAQVGGMLSVFDLCKIRDPKIEVEMRGAYEGTITARW